MINGFERLHQLTPGVIAAVPSMREFTTALAVLREQVTALSSAFTAANDFTLASTRQRAYSQPNPKVALITRPVQHFNEFNSPMGAVDKPTISTENNHKEIYEEEDEEEEDGQDEEEEEEEEEDDDEEEDEDEEESDGE